MTEPVSNKKPQVTAYAGIQGGVVRNASNENYANAGAILGGEVNYKRAFARAQVMGGTAVGMNAQIGYEFDLGKNMGLELSAKAQTNHSLISTKKENNTNNSYLEQKFQQYGINDGANNQAMQQVNISNGDINIQAKQQSTTAKESKWHKGMQQFGARAQLNFGTKNAKFGVGIEAGTRNSFRPSISECGYEQTQIDVKIGDKINTSELFGHQNLTKVEVGPKGYITPTLQADVNLGKGFSLNADADAYQGNVGVRYTF